MCSLLVAVFLPLSPLTQNRLSVPPKTQFGLPVLRQGVDAAMSLHHLLVSTEGALEVIQGHLPLQCSHSSARQLPSFCMDMPSDEELWRTSEF